MRSPLVHLRLAIQPAQTGPALFCGVYRPKANHRGVSIFTNAPEVRVLPSAGITRLRRSYDPVRLPPASPPKTALRPLPHAKRVSPDCPHHPSGVPCPLPRRIERVHASIASPSMLPSPFCRRVGIRTSTFEACSGFTRVTAHRIAQPPKAAFVTRLQPVRSPVQAARQLPDQSTILRVEPPSTGGPRLRGALHKSRYQQRFSAENRGLLRDPAGAARQSYIRRVGTWCNGAPCGINGSRLALSCSLPRMLPKWAAVQLCT